jgi:DnaK suppressor protein
MISKEQKEELIAIIKAETAKLTNKIEELKSFAKPEAPDNAIGRISRMDAINNKSIVDASLRNLHTRLDQLQKISQVIHDKDYGLCIKCHRTIAFERLKIRPEVRLCAGCLQKRNN